MKFFPKTAFLFRGLRFFLLAMALSSCGGLAPYSDSELPSGGYVGMEKKRAIQRAQKSGNRFRIIEEDGKRMRVTKDYRPERLNFTIQSGKVTRVNQG
ncbi:hypothetical protein N8513_00755 [bacterium]|nr:hypothetical protein [bacterium]MDA7517738.1 hypothetical protein [Akkermansiaceae bacterium]MDA7537089.1 hypothetical protein [bacterium]MDA7611541.1 hypothetical protein [bacterium]MDA8980561.1 hypothetical protein [bacterium]